MSTLRKQNKWSTILLLRIDILDKIGLSEINETVTYFIRIFHMSQRTRGM